MILDLGLGQRGLLHHRPHDRLRPAIELAAHRELQQLAGDHRLGLKIHRQIGVLEVALDAEAAELLGLDAHPVGGEFPTFLAELVDLDLVLVLALGPVGFLDLPLDRQAVAVPAGHVVGVVAAHLEGAVDDVLEDLVEGMADVEIAVGIGRAVVQDVFRPAFRRLAQLAVKVHLVPPGQPFRLGLGQAGAHRELGLRQEEGLGVVDGFACRGSFGRLRLVGHDLGQPLGGREGSSGGGRKFGGDKRRFPVPPRAGQAGWKAGRLIRKPIGNARRANMVAGFSNFGRR